MMVSQCALSNIQKLAEETALTSVGNKWQSKTRQDLIIEVWEALDCESVGARELEEIQDALRSELGEGGAESPASIARTVADEGAVLRHPEVFECDLKWRRRNLAELNFDFSNLDSAFESLIRIEELCLELTANDDSKAFEKLRGVVLASRDELAARSRSKILESGEREQAKEISHWLSVWLQSPELFSDWLDLRRHSAEFQKKFT